MDRRDVGCSEAVLAAREAGRAVVALESTVVTHGLPWPQNREAALRCEQAVRDAGAEPATVAVLGGLVRVGLATDEIVELARGAARPVKASRRDLAAVTAAGLSAGTTVSATLFLARRAGISIMATGGLGGVHRDASQSFDVSTDLDELARADGMLLVCSGVKTILDLPATLEALETRGVPMLGYRTNCLPAFTASTSGLALDWRVDSPRQAADILRQHQDLGIPGAVILAQEAPAESAVPQSLMEQAVEAALRAAHRAGVSGKPLTPFLLDQVRQYTDGQSMVANVALLEANARLAAEVAVERNRRGPSV